MDSAQITINRLVEHRIPIQPVDPVMTQRSGSSGTVYVVTGRCGGDRFDAVVHHWQEAGTELELLGRHRTFTSAEQEQMARAIIDRGAHPDKVVSYPPMYSFGAAAEAQFQLYDRLRREHNGDLICLSVPEEDVKTASSLGAVWLDHLQRWCIYTKLHECSQFSRWMPGAMGNRRVA